MFKLNFKIYTYLFCEGRSMHTTAEVWRSEDNLRESVPPFTAKVPGIKLTQVLRLGSKKIWTTRLPAYRWIKWPCRVTTFLLCHYKCFEKLSKAQGSLYAGSIYNASFLKIQFFFLVTISSAWAAMSTVYRVCFLFILPLSEVSVSSVSLGTDCTAMSFLSTRWRCFRTELFPSWVYDKNTWPFRSLFL